MKDLYGDNVSKDVEAKVKEFIQTIKEIMAGEKLTKVEAEYSGSGDSGDIENVSAYKGTKVADFPGVLQDKIYDIIEALHGRFEDGDGGGGRLTFTLRKGVLQVKYHMYYLELTERGTHTAFSV